MIEQGIVTTLIGFLEKYPSLMDVKVQQVITDMLIDLDNKILLKLFLKNFLLNIDLIAKTNNGFKAFISQTATVLYRKRKWLSEIFPIDWIVKSLILHCYAAEAKSKSPEEASAKKEPIHHHHAEPKQHGESSNRDESLFSADVDDFQALIKQSNKETPNSQDGVLSFSVDGGDSLASCIKDVKTSSLTGSIVQEPSLKSDTGLPKDRSEDKASDILKNQLELSEPISSPNLTVDTLEKGVVTDGSQTTTTHIEEPSLVKSLSENLPLKKDLFNQCGTETEHEPKFDSLLAIAKSPLFEDRAEMLSQLENLKESSGENEDLRFLTSNIDYLVTIIESILEEKETLVDHLQRNMNFIVSSLCFPNIPYPLQRYLLRICSVIIEQLKTLEPQKAQEIVSSSNAIFALIDLFKITKCYKTKAEILPMLEDLAAMSNTGLKRVAQFLSIFSASKIEVAEDYPGVDIEADITLFFSAIFTLVTKNMRQIDNDKRIIESLSSRQEEERRAANTGFLECLLNLYSHLNYSTKAILLTSVGQVVRTQSITSSEIFNK